MTALAIFAVEVLVIFVCVAVALNEFSGMFLRILRFAAAIGVIIFVVNSMITNPDTYQYMHDTYHRITGKELPTAKPSWLQWAVQRTGWFM